MHLSLRIPAAVMLLASTLHPATAAHAIERISVATGGGQGNAQSRYAAISGNGRYIVFTSDADNLVAGDSNAMADVFLRDRLLGTTTRVSTMANGSQSDGPSYEANISGDGSRVVFASHGHLLANSGYQNCYLLDRTAHTLQVLDLLPNAQPAATCNAVSIDYLGMHVAMESLDALQAGDNAYSDVYVRDLAGTASLRVSSAAGGGQANGSSANPRISADGSRVIFASGATNLVPGDSNGEADIFLASATNSVALTRVDVGPSGVQASAPGGTGLIAALNADGSLLAFSSKAQSLPNWGQFAEATLYLRVPSLDQTIALSIPEGSLPREGFNYEPDFDYSGRWLVFASSDVLYSGAEPGIYVIDVVDALIQLVSVGGNSENVHQPRLSADGSGIVWHSLSTTQVPGDTNGTWDAFYADNPLWVETSIFTDGFDGP